MSTGGGVRTPYETLKETALFSGLTWEQCRGLVERSSMCKMRDGDAVIHQGTTGDDSMWIILEGGVEVCVGDTPIATYGEGSYIGELTLLAGSDAPRTADVRVVGETSLMEIKRADLVSLVKDDAEAALAIMTELARRLRHTTVLLAKHAGSDDDADIAAIVSLGPIEAG